MGTMLFETCDLCDRQEDAARGIFIHSLSGYPGYGSVFDEEYVTLHLCSECLDRLLMKKHKAPEKTKRHK